MRRVLFILLACVGFAFPARSGPNAGGVILLHDPDTPVTTDQSTYCGIGTAPPGCESFDTRLDAASPDHPRVWKVYAVFPAGARPRLKG